MRELRSLGIDDLFALPPWQVLAYLYAIFTNGKTKDQRAELDTFLKGFDSERQTGIPMVTADRESEQARSRVQAIRDRERELFGDAYGKVMGDDSV